MVTAGGLVEHFERSANKTARQARDTRDEQNGKTELKQQERDAEPEITKTNKRAHNKANKSNDLQAEADRASTMPVAGINKGKTQKQERNEDKAK